jgi:hypothetical protein
MNEIERIKAEIAAQRESRRKAAEAFEAARELEQLKAELEDEKRLAKEDKEFARIETEHGLGGREIARVNTPRGMIVLKRPNHLLYKRWIDTSSDKANTTDSMKLVRPCVVYPSPEDFDALLEVCPSALMTCVNAIAYLAGVRAEAIEGK